MSRVPRTASPPSSAIERPTTCSGDCPKKSKNASLASARRNSPSARAQRPTANGASRSPRSRPTACVPPGECTPALTTRMLRATGVSGSILVSEPTLGRVPVTKRPDLGDPVLGHANGERQAPHVIAQNDGLRQHSCPHFGDVGELHGELRRAHADALEKGLEL